MTLTKKTRPLKCTAIPSACSSEMEWRECPQFPGYWVSEYGDLVTSRGGGRRLKGFLDYDGYPSYKISRPDESKCQISAHRMVAFAFLEEPKAGQNQIAHKNGSRLFCHFENLQWSDAMGNRKDTQKHGTSSAKGDRNPKAKLTEQDILRIRTKHRDIKEGRCKMKVFELAALYGVNISTICNIAAKKTWQHVN